MARLPDGDPAPADGALPSGALASLDERAFGVYVHVPFCTARCGYCDFNVYVERDLRPGFASGVGPSSTLAARALGGPPPATTVFVGGGTPTVLDGRRHRRDPARRRRSDRDRERCRGHDRGQPGERRRRQARRAARGRGERDLARHAERAATRAAGTRPSAYPGAARARRSPRPRAAGFDVVGLDLIFGCHAESDADWDATLAEAVALAPDRVSAYELTVEPGTRLAARVRSGELPPPDEDARARRYVAAEEAFAAAGLSWYEISSWARDEPARSRHNWGYWTGRELVGRRARARTATSAACAGGTRCTRARGAPRWRLATPRPRAARPLTPRRAARARDARAPPRPAARRSDY